MNPILQQFFSYVRKPQPFFNESLTLQEKWKTIGWMLGLSFVLVFCATPLIALVDSFVTPLKQEQFEEILGDLGLIPLLLLVAVVAPILEESIFRLFLKYKRNFIFRAFDRVSNGKAKIFWHKNFRFFYYFSAIIFSLIHIGNYDNSSLLFYVFAPIIVLPQLIAGFTFGYVRMKLGFLWAVLMHGLYNFIIVGSSLLFLNNLIVSDINNEEISLKIETIEMGLGKESILKHYRHQNVVDSIFIKNTKISVLALQLFPTDSVLLKNNKRINLRFINHHKKVDAHLIIAQELKKQ
ncbi:MAG: CPBP family intramembrane metalloprotease [Flavobacteriaceae bacterium]|nr:CPBP family intramembrane metalloprotease [Flavobacteriaceae bacterium]